MDACPIESTKRSVRPDGVLWIEAEKSLPQAVGHGSQGHGRPGMPGVGLLDGIHRKRPDGVDAQLIYLLAGHHDLLSITRFCADTAPPSAYAPIRASKMTIERGCAR